MFRRAREVGPAFLVPSAWTVVVAERLGIVTSRPVAVMHAVMAVLLVAFAAGSWRAMDAGVLRVWRGVVVVGTLPTLVGLIGFLVGADAAGPFLVSLVGWMALPAVGFAYTAWRLPDAAWYYVAGAAGCLLGGALYIVAPAGAEPLRIAGLVVAGGGQTLGIVHAALRF